MCILVEICVYRHRHFIVFNSAAQRYTLGSVRASSSINVRDLNTKFVKIFWNLRDIVNFVIAITLVYYIGILFCVYFCY
jgi:hypothetical protein